MKGAGKMKLTALVFAILVGAVMVVLVDGPVGPEPAAAKASAGTSQVITACPGPFNPITQDTELGSNLVAGPLDNPCVLFGASNIRLDLKGFAIDMRSAGNARAIDTNGQNNVRIIGDDGFVLTTYTGGPSVIVDAIIVNGGSGVRVEEVRVRNVLAGSPATAPCVPFGLRGGTGMFLTGVNGARVIENLVECYARGVDVFSSDASAEKEIGRNIIRNNTSGLRLNGADGWHVLLNTVTGNGFPDPSHEQPGIGISEGSSGNDVVRNVVDNNAHGITVFNTAAFAGPLPFGNAFVRNHATGNGTDLFDENPTVVNSWHFNNICNIQQGFGIPPGVCNPGEM